MIRQSSNTHNDHILCLYKDRSDRLKFLVKYFREGLDKGCLCIYVSPDSTEKIADEFKAAGLNIHIALKKGRLRIFNMAETYLPNGQFVSNYMIENVTNFIVDAEDQGYKGLYTAGEMAWLQDNMEFIADAEAYERDVAALQQKYSSFMGACLYPTLESAIISESARRTHPSRFDEDAILPNADYILTS